MSADRSSSPGRGRASLVAAAAVCAALAGCGEHAQTATQRKADQHAYEGPATAFTAGSWKAGDPTAWATQMRTRSQGQNEYSRAGAPP